MPTLANSRDPLIEISTPMPPPMWALLERELIRAQSQAIELFFQKYFDERGYLLCVPRWGGNDGPDDAGENMLNWTMLYVLGGPEKILGLFHRAWEGHLRQYTEAKTVEVPLGREGMYYREFPTTFDWWHTGEWLSPYVLLGLADPGAPEFAHRIRRYAGFYMDEDPLARNYDPKRKLIKSLFNGSRGPLLRKATGLDWAGDPIEVEGRFKPGHGEENYDQMIAHFKDYGDIVGDHPLNLGATTLALTAFALTGDPKYRNWCLDYANAWVERTELNGGLTPTNIGLDGKIGGGTNGKWYGGVWGWGFSVVVPQTGEVAHRPDFYTRCHYGFGNALLMSGDPRFVDVWRGVIERVNSKGRKVRGKLQYPRSFGDNGWYNFQPSPFDEGALEVWYWSMKPADRELVSGDPWVRFLHRPAANTEASYPVDSLRQDIEAVRTRVQGVRDDDTSPDARMSDDMNHLNPAATDALNRLMLGGIPTGRVGYPLHARVRYFDPARRRPGIPEDVAALVDRMSADETSLTLVNLSQVEARTAVVQGGAYGEHRITEVRLDGPSANANRTSTSTTSASTASARAGGAQLRADRASTRVSGRYFTVRLAPGAGAHITLRMDRYASPPTLATPWS